MEEWKFCSDFPSQPVCQHRPAPPPLPPRPSYTSQTPAPSQCKHLYNHTTVKWPVTFPYTLAWTPVGFILFCLTAAGSPPPRRTHLTANPNLAFVSQGWIKHAARTLGDNLHYVSHCAVRLQGRGPSSATGKGARHRATCQTTASLFLPSICLWHRLPSSPRWTHTGGSPNASNHRWKSST